MHPPQFKFAMDATTLLLLMLWLSAGMASAFDPASLGWLDPSFEDVLGDPARLRHISYSIDSTKTIEAESKIRTTYYPKAFVFAKVESNGSGDGEYKAHVRVMATVIINNDETGEETVATKVR